MCVSKTKYLPGASSRGFARSQFTPTRYPWLGYSPMSLVFEGVQVPDHALQVARQPEVSERAYDAGAATQADFFAEQLRQSLVPDLDPLERRIVECMLAGGTVRDYKVRIEAEPLFEDDAGS